MSTQHFRKGISILILFSLLTAFAAVPASASVEASSVYCAQWHTVQRGENLFRIAQRYGTSVAHLQSLNNIANVNRIYAGQNLCVRAGSSGSTYVVQYGDTLSKIARRYGVNMWVLAQVNHISNINRIYAGQRLLIPDFTIQ
jgi:LysM repeat protein